jgi:hypothetical protein
VPEKQVDAFFILRRPKGPKAVTKWEYKAVVYVRTFRQWGDAEPNERQLNKLGDEGWELINNLGVIKVLHSQTGEALNPLIRSDEQSDQAVVDSHYWCSMGV